jgi:2-polyprenyl-6-methoxyphenol hydroxylase-like FAD-dependent oxidoreductase
MTAGDTAPVVIVGGGPVGLAAALELSHHGVHSIVVETRTDVSWLQPRAKTTSARSMEHFRRWGIANTVRERAPLSQAWSDEVVFCTTVLGREVTRFDRCFGLHLRHDELVAEGGQQAPQPLIELVMRERVTALPAVELLTGRKVTSIEQHDDHVVVVTHDDTGTQRTIQADYALGCDGPRSTVRDAIGVTLDGSKDGRPNFNVVFRSSALSARMAHNNFVHHWVLNPDQPGVVGRLDLDDRWWCIAIGVNADRGSADPERLVRQLIGAESPQLPIEVIATDPWQARMQLADSYGSERVYLAGDAAHQNPPWGGHGFNTGIGDAVNIGWKLAAVLQGWASPAVLDTYELERRPVAADTIAVASRNMATLAPELTDMRLIGSDKEFAAVRLAVETIVQRTKYDEFHSLDLVLGTSYRTSPIVCSEPRANHGGEPFDGDNYQPSAAPGNRLPHTWLTSSRSLYDELGPSYSLVGEMDAKGAPRIADAAHRFGIPLTPVPLPRGMADRLFEAPLVLVRPDQHVAWRGTDYPDPEQLWKHVTGRSRQPTAKMT